MIVTKLKKGGQMEVRMHNKQPVVVFDHKRHDAGREFVYAPEETVAFAFVDWDEMETAAMSMLTAAQKGRRG